MNDKRIPPKEINPKGLHARYHVQKIAALVPKTDFLGNTYFEPEFTDVDPGAEYFVMRVDAGGKDQKHVKACRKAAVYYAGLIRFHIPGLSRDLIERYGENSDGYDELMQPLFNLMSEMHDLTLLQSEMQQIIDVVNGMQAPGFEEVKQLAELLADCHALFVDMQEDKLFSGFPEDWKEAVGSLKSKAEKLL